MPAADAPMADIPLQGATAQGAASVMANEVAELREIIAAQKEAIRVMERMKRKPLPLGAPFDGDKNLFAAWKALITHKLRSDQMFIGDHPDQWAFVYQHLSAAVQTKVAPFFERGADFMFNPNCFLDYLDTMFSDPHRRQTAMTELEKMSQQRAEPFSDFLVRFEAKLALSGGSEWASEIKVMRLRRALTSELRQCCVGRDIPLDDYPAAVRRIRSIAVDIESFRLDNTLLPARAQAAITAGQDGDVPMSGVNKVSSTSGWAAKKKQGSQSQQRAVWVSQDTIQARRAEGSCLRCGQQGHMVRTCRLLPAQRPTQRTQVRTTQTTPAGDSPDQEGIQENGLPPQ